MKGNNAHIIGNAWGEELHRELRGRTTVAWYREVRGGAESESAKAGKQQDVERYSMYWRWPPGNVRWRRKMSTDGVRRSGSERFPVQ